MPKNTNNTHPAYTKTCVIITILVCFFLLPEHVHASYIGEAAVNAVALAFKEIFNGLLKPLLIILIGTGSLVGSLLVWIIYHVSIFVLTLFVLLAIQLVESTLVPTVGSLAYDYFYSPVIQNGIYDGLWVPSRDLVHVFLALILLIGAIMVIIQANKEFLQQHATKFILAIIAVNFSWFIPGVILDISNVATKTVAGLASLPPCQNCRVITKVSSLPTPESEEVAFETYITEELVGPNSSDGRLIAGGLTAYYGQLLKQGANIIPMNIEKVLVEPFKNILSALKTGDLNIVIAGNVRSIPGPILIITMAILYVVALLALAVVFLIRIPILWLTMGFMPFIILGYLVPTLKPYTSKIGTAFLGAAFIPVLASVPLTAGSIVLRLIRVPIQPGIQGLMLFFIPITLSIGIVWLGIFAALQSFDFAGGAVTKTTGWFKGVGQGSALSFGAWAAQRAPGTQFAIPLLKKFPGAAKFAQLQPLAKLRERMGVKTPEERKKRAQEVAQKIAGLQNQELNPVQKQQLTELQKEQRNLELGKATSKSEAIYKAVAATRGAIGKAWQQFNTPTSTGKFILGGIGLAARAPEALQRAPGRVVAATLRGENMSVGEAVREGIGAHVSNQDTTRMHEALQKNPQKLEDIKQKIIALGNTADKDKNQILDGIIGALNDMGTGISVTRDTLPNLLGKIQKISLKIPGEKMFDNTTAEELEGDLDLHVRKAREATAAPPPAAPASAASSKSEAPYNYSPSITPPPPESEEKIPLSDSEGSSP